MKNFFVHKSALCGNSILSINGKVLPIPAFAINKIQLEKIINYNSFEEYNKIPVVEIGKKVFLKKEMYGLDSDVLDEYGGREVTITHFEDNTGKINFEENKSCKAFYIVDIDSIIDTNNE